MSTPTPTPASPLSKWNHIAIIVGLSAAGAAIGSLQTFIADPAGTMILTGIGALIGEALTYEHSE